MIPRSVLRTHIRPGTHEIVPGWAKQNVVSSKVSKTLTGSSNRHDNCQTARRRLDMKSDYLRNKIGRILLASSFIAGIGLAASMAAQAQRPWDRNQDRQNRSDRDRRDRDRNYRRDRDNDRNQDYSRNRDDRYGRNGGYGNNGGYGGYDNSSQIAMNQGYQDGLYTGSSDAQRGQNYNPQRSHFY